MNQKHDDPLKYSFLWHRISSNILYLFVMVIAILNGLMTLHKYNDMEGITFLVVGLLMLVGTVLGFILSVRNRKIYTQINQIEERKENVLQSDSIADFIDEYDVLISNIETLEAKYPKLSKKLYDIDFEKADMQQHLQDLISAETEYTCNIMKNDSSFNPEFRNRIYEEFDEDMQDLVIRFDSSAFRRYVEEYTAQVYLLYCTKLPISELKNKAYNANSAIEFLEYYDLMITGMTTFKKKYPKQAMLELDIDSEIFDMQWHLRNVIQNESNHVVSQMNNMYVNSKKHRIKLYEDFVSDMNRVSVRFEETETWEMAKKCTDRVFHASGAETPIHASLFSQINKDIPNEDTPSVTDDGVNISEIDGMEGHKFEYWCAALMRKNGFNNVTVTQGSGDQGIDIVATKDGVKYGVQCKNYAGQLGNKPVQEAYSGKTFYQCHVGVVMTNSSFTQGAKDLARSTGILLWDRNTIIEMMKASQTRA